MSKTKTFIRAAVQHRAILLGCFVGGIVLSMVSYRFVTKRYKIQCVVGISTHYFQNPMVRDFMPETFDAQEIRAQRDSIIRQALNHKFLAAIGNKYKLFGKKEPAQITSFDLDTLGRSFEVVPAGPTSFLIGLFSDDGDKGFQLMQDFLNHIRQTLNEERTSTLSRLHDAIRDRLEALSTGEHTVGMNPVLASRPDLVKAEISRAEEEMARLRESYSEKHPRVVQLNKRIDELNGYLRPAVNDKVSPPARTRAASFSGAKIDASSKDLFQDLLKKFHYLEVVIFLDQQSQESYLSILQEPFVPQSPMWPKRIIFLLWGAVGGFLVGAIGILFMEVLRNRSWKSWLED